MEIKKAITHKTVPLKSLDFGSVFKFDEDSCRDTYYMLSDGTDDDNDLIVINLSDGTLEYIDEDAEVVHIRATMEVSE